MAKISGDESVDIDAPGDQVWAAITDIDSHEEWQSGVKSTNVKERDADGRPLVVESVSDAKVKDIKYVLRYTYEEPTKMSWSFVDGDVNDMYGSYTVTDNGDGTSRLDFSLTTEVGGRLGMMMRGPIVDQVRAYTMGGTLKDIKNHVESGARA